MHRDQVQRDVAGAIFAEPDVARSYSKRPPYASALFGRLAELAPAQRRALDIGCGPGTIAIPLADRFAEVVALDPSGPMLDEARAADAGRHPNIRWVQGKAESFESTDGFDLTTVGTAIHWPDHAVLFPKLAGWTRVLAVVGNADLMLACGEAAALDFLKRWLEIMAERTPGVRGTYDPVGFATEMTRHEPWMDIAGRERFEQVWRQSLADYIDAAHSQATWSRAAMGPALAGEFDRQLEALHGPYAVGGEIELRYATTLTWGRPREEKA